MALELGVSINPVAFLVAQNDNIKLVPISHTSSIDKLLDYVPDLIEKTNTILNSCIENKKMKTQAILQKLQNKQNEKNDKEIKKEKDNKIKEEQQNGKFKKDEIIKEEIIKEKNELEDE